MIISPTPIPKLSVFGLIALSLEKQLQYASYYDFYRASGCRCYRSCAIGATQPRTPSRTTAWWTTSYRFMASSAQARRSTSTHKRSPVSLFSRMFQHSRSSVVETLRISFHSRLPRRMSWPDTRLTVTISPSRTSLRHQIPPSASDTGWTRARTSQVVQSSCLTEARRAGQIGQ